MAPVIMNNPKLESFLKRPNLKLSHKVFLSLVLSAVIVQVGIQGTAQYLINSSTTERFGNRFFLKMERLTSALEGSYSNQGSWEPLTKQDNWKLFLSVTFPQTSLYRQVLSEPQRFLFPGIMALFDADGYKLVGAPGSEEEYVLTPLTVNDEVVGYLGLRFLSVLFDVVEFDDSRKMWILFSVGVGILVISLAVSFFLSRHLLIPLRELASATQAIAGHKLSTRIEVKSGGELGALTRDFNSMAEQLERAEEMQVQWLTDISHELRTPLSIIRGELEAMQDGVREVTPSALDSLHSEVVRLVSLVNDLHTLSIADCGSRSLREFAEPVDPVEILKTVLAMYEPAMGRKGLSVSTSFSNEKSLVNGHRERLVQLYTNLLDNALAYCDTPGFFVIREARDETGLEITLSDSGPGVSDDARPRLFDRLYRADRARSRETGGSGLGLAICKSIAEAHGGEIEAFGNDSGGLTLRIWFPVVLQE